MNQKEISIPVNNSFIAGNLTVVPATNKLVIFAHGSGSSRFSTRNQFVATYLNQAGISTFLFDLLTPEEEKVDQVTRQCRFDIPLLANRLVLVTNWLKSNPETTSYNLGYFGASTGAAAALIAGAQLPQQIKAVVSRGGRPDLAGIFLSQIQAATLLIVGERDEDVLELNQMAYEQLHCTKELVIIPGATHLFEEPGTLEQIAHISIDWFLKFLI